MSCNWNEQNFNFFMSINWRASLVPAAAVFLAPMAYIGVVAVKKLVVGFSVEDDRSALSVCIWLSLDIFRKNASALDCCGAEIGSFFALRPPWSISHACLSISSQMVKVRMAHSSTYSLFDGCCYMDNCGSSRANTCIQGRLCRRVVFIRSKTNPGSCACLKFSNFFKVSVCSGCSATLLHLRYD